MHHFAGVYRDRRAGHPDEHRLSALGWYVHVAVCAAGEPISSTPEGNAYPRSRAAFQSPEGPAGLAALTNRCLAATLGSLACT